MSEYALNTKVAYPDLGILEGDQLKVRHQASAEPGQLVVAVVDGCAQVVPFEPEMKILGLLLEVAGPRG